MNDQTADLHPAEPVIRQRRTLSLVWLIPIVAALLAGFLLWRSWSQQGPTIQISFRFADGIEVGKTKLKLKAVDMGTVSAVHLSPTREKVLVEIATTREATQDLTERARFWLVKPRVAAGTISGLDTLLSGSYIAIDPGAPGGKRQEMFTALEIPPVVASDEPGRPFLLHASQLGSIGPGSPVLYHGLTVGEVQGYDLGAMAETVTLHVFVRAPFSEYVREGSRFWNTSGIMLQTNADGVKLRVESLQAVLSGAVGFDTPPELRSSPEARPDKSFTLFADEDAAKAASYSRLIPMIARFEGSVRGLSVGSPVELFGIRVGSVTDVRLQFNDATGRIGVAVYFDVQRDRFNVDNAPDDDNMTEAANHLVAQGMRAQLNTTNILTGQLAIALDFFPDAQPAPPLATEGKYLVMPTQPGDIAGITRSVSDIADKLNRLPLDEIGKSVLGTLQSVDQLTASPALKASLVSLSGATASLQEVIKRLNDGLTPALRRLPELTASLQKATDSAAKAMTSIQGGYGAGSDFSRSVSRLLVQVNDMSRAVRFLAEYLRQHPESLIRGRTDQGARP